MLRARLLPQMQGGVFLTDGGIETTLMFQDGFDLPHFAAFVLLDDARGREGLRRYYRRYLDLAASAADCGFVLEGPTWRASTDWGQKLGRDARTIDVVNRDAMSLMHELRDEYAPRLSGALVVSGAIGPRGDGYVAGQPMDAKSATDYHSPQVTSLREGGADMVAAMTMTTSGEAIGVACAAAEVGLPCSISFTLETDGRLPSGEQLRDAIEKVDDASSGSVAYFAINCAHPSHFEATLCEAGEWRDRLRGIRANASRKSHAELDEATELDAGDPVALGQDYRRLRAWLPRVSVLGGCCGTDERHVAAIRAAWNV